MAPAALSTLDPTAHLPPPIEFVIPEMPDEIEIFRSTNEPLNTTVILTLFQNFADNTTATYLTTETVAGNPPPNMLILCLLLSLAVLTVVGNLLVITFSMTASCLHMSISVFITSLAVADFAVGLFVIPIAAFYTAFGRWTFGAAMCYTWSALDVLASTCSIIHLSIISLERFFAVTRPLRAMKYRQRRYFNIVAVVVWAISIAISIPLFILVPPTGVEQSECHFTRNGVYLIVSSLISFYLPFIIMIFVYARIFQVIRNQLGSWRRGFLSVRTQDGQTLTTMRVHRGGAAAMAVAGSALLTAPTLGGSTDMASVKLRPAGHIGAHRFHSSSEASPPSARQSMIATSHENSRQILSRLRTMTHSESQSATNRPTISQQASVQSHADDLGEKAETSSYDGSLSVRPSPKPWLINRNSLQQPQNPANLLKPVVASLMSSMSSLTTPSSSAQQSSRAIRGEIKAVFTFAAVFGTFVFCWMPFFVLNFITGIAAISGSSNSFLAPDSVLYPITAWLGYVNSALNPLIYAFAFKKFRLFFKCCNASGLSSMRSSTSANPAQPATPKTPSQNFPDTVIQLKRSLAATLSAGGFERPSLVSRGKPSCQLSNLSEFPHVSATAPSSPVPTPKRERAFVFNE